MASHLRKQLALALGVAALLAAEVAPAVARPVGPSPATPAERLREDTRAIHALGVSGVQARAVGPGGRHTVATSGTSDLETGRPVHPDGYFRMASTSKALVATVVLQLEAEGRLSLHDSVDHWLPGVVRGNGNDGRRITLRHLLQHTSGIPDALPGYTDPKEYEEQRFRVYSSERLVELAMEHAPDFDPGEDGEWEYSNTGYVLLDMVVEKVTGRPAHQEIEDRVVRPLGMDRTRRLGIRPTLPRPHARAYELFDAENRVDVTDQVMVDHANLSWVTTTRDENTFFRALLGGRLLPERQLAKMKQTVPVNAELQKLWPGGGYGLGLVERPLKCGGTYWSHEGGDGGYITLNGVTEDGRRSAVVSMSEARGDSLEHVMEQESAASELVENALCARS